MVDPIGFRVVDNSISESYRTTFEVRVLFNYLGPTNLFKGDTPAHQFSRAFYDSNPLDFGLSEQRGGAQWSMQRLTGNGAA
jgi:hypothetical protein